MKNKPFVFLPIEIITRELDYKLNLARHFCKSGFHAIIGNPPFIRDELKYKNYKGVFIEKGLNPIPEYYKHLKQKGIYLYDLTDEGFGECVYDLSFQNTIKALSHMRKIFLWGEGQKSEFLKKYNVIKFKNMFHVVGNPSFDLSLPKYKSMYRQLKPKHLPESYILINTNFSGYHGYTLEEHLESCPSLSPKTRQSIIDTYHVEKEQFTIFKQWIETIIKNFPNENFLIRPHPSEIEKNYKNLFSQYKNVFISKEGNINEVMSCSKILLHKNCTTALQGYLMGIPIISIGGKKIHAKTQTWHQDFGTTPNTVEELIEEIKYLLLNKKWNSIRQSKIDLKSKKMLDSYFYSIGNSTKNIVDFVINDTKKIFKNNNPYTLIDSRSSVQKIKNAVRKFLPLHYKVPISTRETFIRFNKQDIMRKLNLFELADPLGIDFKVTKIFPNTFRIEKK